MQNPTTTASRAFRASMSHEFPVIGEPAISRVETLQVEALYGWEVCHVELSRYGSMSWTLRDADGERASLTAAFNGEGVKSQTASAVVLYVSRLGYRMSESATRENLEVLRRIQAAATEAIADCERRLAEIDAAMAADLAEAAK